LEQRLERRNLRNEKINAKLLNDSVNIKRAIDPNHQPKDKQENNLDLDNQSNEGIRN